MLHWLFWQKNTVLCFLLFKSTFQIVPAQKNTTSQHKVIYVICTYATSQHMCNECKQDGHHRHLRYYHESPKWPNVLQHPIRLIVVVSKHLYKTIISLELQGIYWAKAIVHFWLKGYEVHWLFFLNEWTKWDLYINWKLKK